MCECQGNFLARVTLVKNTNELRFYKNGLCQRLAKLTYFVNSEYFQYGEGFFEISETVRQLSDKSRPKDAHNGKE